MQPTGPTSIYISNGAYNPPVTHWSYYTNTPVVFLLTTNKTMEVENWEVPGLAR